VVEEHLQDLSSYKILDICAGAGGPTPVLESEINSKLESEGKKPVQFILSDLYPHHEEWSRISKKQQNVTYIEKPVDARAAPRFAAKGMKECRIFNICFHHFGDEDAAGILKNNIESADAFM
jgi:salicylate hydroxylase